jgi:hypothetical protein
VTRDPSRAHAAAQSEATDTATLAELASSEHIFVREAVALNPKTTVQTLSGLVPVALDTDDAFRVAIALLSNPNSPDSVLRQLGGLAQAVTSDRYVSRHFWVLMFLDALAAHARVTAEFLGSLLKPDLTRKHVRDRISRRATNTSVLSALAGDPSSGIRSRVAKALTGAGTSIGEAAAEQSVEADEGS